ncbi:MAG: hypothetical protein ACHRXM_14980 [Isosphaerales bacterium]
MRLAYPRFTIRTLMIVVAISAGILALYQTFGGPGLLMACFGLSYIGLIGVLWSMFRGFRRLSALCFGIAAALANVGCFLVCVYRQGIDRVLLMSLVWLVPIPIMLGAGVAWAVNATHRNAVPRRSALVAWPLVLGLGLAPLPIMLTRWPLRLAFELSRPALERLADRVAAGQRLAAPEWAGIFYVVGSAVDPASGNVGLIIDSAPTGRSGFVRVGRGIFPDRIRGPFYNLNVYERLGGRWSYQTED